MVVLIKPTTYAIDSDALNYINRVEQEDAQGLEPKVKLAYDIFFKGLKKDSLLTKLKASCILGGARTISGALTPLLPSMPLPTNFGFVSGDRTRQGGIKGKDTAYININRQADADPQDNYHQVAWVSELVATAANGGHRTVIATGWTSPTSHTLVLDTAAQFRSRASAASLDVPPLGNGFYGHSRSEAANLNYLLPSGNVLTGAQSSTASATRKTFVFGRNNSNTGDADPTLFGINRVLFYSVGESVNLVNFRQHLNTLASNLSVL